MGIPCSVSMGCPDYGVSSGPESVGRVAREEKMTQMPFVQCPVCGGEMVEKEVEKLLRGGIHLAVVAVRAEVCLRCGERLYSQETVRYFANIRTKLKRQETADFQPLGQSFIVPAHSK
jgi:YgiT-type zinc finger domain-containing protein